MFEAKAFPRFNLYEVLGLPFPKPGRAYNAEEIKTAYRRALLRYHPDKVQAAGVDEAQPNGLDAEPVPPKYSIDDISAAKDILLDPGRQREYNRHLLEQIDYDEKHALTRPVVSGTGLEMIDLEDMDYSEDTEAYTRACRCGSDVGFRVLESELAAEADTGEVVVSCPGCSLAARIIFQVDET